MAAAPGGRAAAGGARPPQAVPARVLVTGGDRRLAALARTALAGGRYELRFAADEAAAADALFTAPPDLVLLLQDARAGDAVRRCRDLHSAADAGIVILAEEATVAERVSALGCADDYVSLPFAPAELAARVDSVLRRTRPCISRRAAVFDDGTLRVDLRTRVVTVGGGPVDLTPTEYRLLALLLGSPGTVFTHGQLLRRGWGAAYAGDSHLLRLHIANLRKKIDPPGGPGHISTHRGVGYAFRPPHSAARAGS